MSGVIVRRYFFAMSLADAVPNYLRNVRSSNFYVTNAHLNEVVFFSDFISAGINRYENGGGV